ncbi:MAG TPA: putative glycoside hydrolase [Micropepsaceae bacterium]|nr:putative glycoside hydrolase [Micropepsaceae bacterium]
MNLRHLILIGIGALAGLFAVARFGLAAESEGQVLDAVTGNAIAGATITAPDETAMTDAAGQFKIETNGSKLMARAPGYRAATAGTSDQGRTIIRLAPFTPKALYLSFYGIGSKAIREAALKTIHEDSDLNAVVIDVKGDRGLVAFKTESAVARAAAADRITTIPDMPALIRELHEAGVYAIARIVVFKDDPLANSRKDLAVKTANDELFHDREGLAWTDPFRREVWDYNVSLAVEAARAGFDEIQFDYVRFPDTKNLRFAEATTLTSRVAAITGFLEEARRKLAPYNVFLAVDVFGYVCWNPDDTGIGQRLEDIVPLVDYISPMLYPSGFSFGIPGYPYPVEHSREIVQLSLARALSRTHVSPLRFRPWLQAFRDYAFDRRNFASDEVRAQIEAAEASGTAGWMLWNPRNDYAGIGF